MEDISPLVLIADNSLCCWLHAEWAATSYHELFPLPSNRHHRSNDDCLEGERENYQLCSVQHCCATVVHSEHLCLTVVCWLNFSVVILCVTVYLFDSAFWDYFVL